MQKQVYEDSLKSFFYHYHLQELIIFCFDLENFQKNCIYYLSQELTGNQIIKFPVPE